MLRTSSNAEHESIVQILIYIRF